MFSSQKPVLRIWHNFNEGNVLFDYIIFAISLDDAVEATDHLYSKEHESSTRTIRGSFQRID